MMNPLMRISSGMSLLAASVWMGLAESSVERQFVAPPTPPPAEHRVAVSIEPEFRAAAASYSIGDPSPEEQLYIEMINRARANPASEAEIMASATDPEVVGSYDFFEVDLALMQAQFAEIPPAQPLAPNAQLTEAARLHTEDMLANSFQEHQGSDGSSPSQRVLAAGYNFSSTAENVYANAHSVFHGHAGFEVDWGPGPGGMQTPPGHRNTIHDPVFREIGVGVLFGMNSPAAGSQIPGSRPVGPQLVSQEFGVRPGSTPFITGVVYFDLNGNNFYDAGEGIGGIRVTASGPSTEAVTARSGGYAIPVAENGTYTVTFSGEDLTSFSREVTVSGSLNQKVDFLPPYVPPAVTGPASPSVGRANSYQITRVPAATTYQWRRYQLTPPVIEGAENGTANVTLQTNGTYNVFEAVTKKSGAFSFHLAHPIDGIRDQFILLNPTYVIGEGGVLRFASRLGWATANQTAKVQISSDNGATWVDVYSQSGTESSGETSFQDRSVNLASFVGDAIRIRFAYIPSGLVYVDTDGQTSWFIDDITFENVTVISNERISDAPNGAFTFEPQVIGDFVLQGRARTGHEYLPWGPAFEVQSVEGTDEPELRISQIRLQNSEVRLEVEVVSGSAPSGVALEAANPLGAAWLPTSATVNAISETSFELIAPLAGGGSGFYRVRSN